MRNRIDPVDLQERYLDDVFRYVSAFVRPEAEAEDVTMEVFHAAFAALSKLRPDTPPRLWLLGIARRKVADSLRKTYRRRESPLTDLAQEADFNRLDEAAAVRQVLAELSEEHRNALVLKYLNELCTEEVAVTLGRSTAATNSLLQRARHAFFARATDLYDPIASPASNPDSVDLPKPKTEPCLKGGTP